MKTTTIIFFLLILSGCATSSYFLTDGDRSAGSVTLRCNHDLATQCEQNKQEMALVASEACRKWGYRGAEAFGGEKIGQTGKYGGGYSEILYQCVGDLEL